MGRAKAPGTVIYFRMSDDLKAEMKAGAEAAGSGLAQHVSHVLSMGWIPKKQREWLRQISKEEGRTPLAMLAYMVELEHRKETQK